MMSSSWKRLEFSGSEYCIATELEFQVLEKALQRERLYYRNHEAAAHELLSMGESVRDPELSMVEHAAWTQIAGTIFNLSEFVTRN